MNVEYTSRTIRERTLRIDTGDGHVHSAQLDAYRAARLNLGRRDRIGDRERQCVEALLALHHAAGRLTADEFRNRRVMAISAVHRIDLDRALHELPPGTPQEWNR